MPFLQKPARITFPKKKKKISSGEKLPGDGCIFIAAVTRPHSHHSHPPAGFFLLEGHSAGWLSELLLPLLQIIKKKMHGNDWSPPVGRWDAEVQASSWNPDTSLTFVFTRRQHSVELLLVVLDQELLTRSDCSCGEKKNQLIYLNKSTENDERKQPRGVGLSIWLCSSYLPHANSWGNTGSSACGCRCRWWRAARTTGVGSTSWGSVGKLRRCERSSIWLWRRHRQEVAASPWVFLQWGFSYYDAVRRGLALHRLAVSGSRGGR